MSTCRCAPRRSHFFRFRLRTFLIVVLLLATTSSIIAERVIYVSNVLKSVRSLEYHGVQVLSDFHDRYGLFAPQDRGRRTKLFEWAFSNPESVTILPCKTATVDLLVEESAALDTLKQLTVYRVSAVGFRQIVRLRNLESLYLDSSEINDESCVTLRRLPKLKTLHLVNVQITDEGIPELARLYALRDVTLTKTKVTHHGFKTLMRLRPDLRISIDLAKEHVEVEGASP